MNQIQILSIGADPEVFLRNKDGKPFSAEGLFGGSKSEPYPMGIGNGFFIQEDNVTAEYNIPPCKTDKEFAESIFKGLQYINKVAKQNDLTIALEAALHFDDKQLSTPHAQMLGCEPDYNIWTLQVNPRPRPPRTLRTAAGHIHIGMNSPQDDQKIAMGRALDVTLGVPSILATKKNERRSLYGRAGAFRDKSYGLEYRTLDNFWLGSRALCKHIFNTVVYTADRINHEGDFFLEELEERKEEIQRVINDYDKDGAIKLIHTLELLPFPV